MLKKYYQEGAKLQEKFENDQIMQKAFILWNKYNSQKTEENKEKLENLFDLLNTIYIYLSESLIVSFQFT